MSFGSQRGFAYTSDGGVIYAIRADESNVELMNATSSIPPVGSVGLPRDLRLRFVKLVASNGSTKKVPIMTVAGYNLIQVGDTVAAPTVGEENPAATAFVVLQKVPERILRRVTSIDTGKIDGDQP